MSYSIPRVSFILACALAALAPTVGLTQSNPPLTGGMSGAASNAPPPPPAAPSASASATAMPDRPVVQQVQTPMPQANAPAAAPAAQEGFGDVTRGLLAAQADGRRAGNALPVLGPVSTAAWNRYLESFKHPIPEWFDRNVEVPNIQ